MHLGNLLLQLIPLLFFVQGAGAFVFSCEEVKYQLYNPPLHGMTTSYVCLVVQEGYTNFDQLKNIIVEEGGEIHRLDVIARAASSCVTRQTWSSSDPWRVIAPKDFDLDCTQEFTLFFTSDPSAVYTPLKEVNTLQLNHEAATLVVPQTGMKIRKTKCTGTAVVTVYGGAGNGVAEERYHLGDWTCSSFPDWLLSFDNVITIEADTGTFECEFSSALTPDSRVHANNGDRIIVLSNGKADDLQNLKGGIIPKHRACIGMASSVNKWATVNMQLNFDSKNSGAVVLQRLYHGADYAFYNGSHTQKFNADYFEIQYNPSGKEPSEIGNSQDDIFVDIYIGTGAPPVTTEEPQVSTTTPLPITTAKATSTPATDNGCYKVVNDSAPFYKAEADCEKGGGFIAAVHDDQKDKFLQKLMNEGGSSSDYFWIGYEKLTKGAWQWEDQSTDPYTNWAANEPSSAAVAKCAYVDKVTGKWGAGNCQVAFPYICQYAWVSKNC